MKGKVVIFLMLTITFSLLVGCTGNGGEEKLYSVLVVQNGDDKTDEMITEEINVSSEKFHEIKFLTSLEDVKEQHPQVEIEQVPAVLIYEIGGGEFKKLEYKTYDMEEAVAKLKELSN
ncbi:hypothetical protein CEH05_18270 [Halobacillus halophilus]|uniref:Small peptidoglycan-associated lipoprotein n=1 Tax=Halobacillus halophilus (strain ATCC 35676 / DSM 2266 / JCM 20832 / KCTC 3685 / LMG 17431 / NBRC 102448 / NCIMB 2269) TaxID=866895 RepID=I0JSE0_HALH3|nr:hypothetical protein [Halobacillus halophilus]ASF40998.1 hypothetical protein CEH05_18270 [Halobacillus halophilus]CCG47062.1 hypothetical protein HBHAL_4724 [Halobacillus halophilus DSM 2266]